MNKSARKYNKYWTKLSRSFSHKVCLVSDFQKIQKLILPKSEIQTAATVFDKSLTPLVDVFESAFVISANG